MVRLSSAGTSPASHDIEMQHPGQQSGRKYRMPLPNAAPRRGQPSAHPNSIVHAALARDRAEAEELCARESSRICSHWIGELGRFSRGVFAARTRYRRSLAGVSRLITAF
jgi:hypothetical protein